MSLREYQRKRDFRKTPEPKGTEKSRSGTAKRLQYVIQKHDATRLHYDFRLELDGTLKSWAVPKGPSLNPQDKRLAAHVEDHPLDYGSFEGIIPEGEYGGGTVMLWDRGWWEPLDANPGKTYREGKLKFNLHGERLHGGWTLVRMGGRRNENGKNWLLIKERDEEARGAKDADAFMKNEAFSIDTERTMEEIAGDEDAVWTRDGLRKEKKKRTAKKSERKKSASKTAKRSRSAKPQAAAESNREPVDASSIEGARKAAMPRSLTPQLATLVKDVPTTDEWVHEIKFDGYRMLGRLTNGAARLITRNRKDWTTKFQPVADAIEELPVRSALIDGEVVVLDPKGVSRFQQLQNALNAKRNGAALVYYAFDLIHLNGYDLRTLPLLERKRVLHALLDGNSADDTIRYSDHVLGEGKAFLQHACRIGLEGIISKRADSAYETKRSKTWLKVKCLRSQEFVIGGFTKPGGSRIAFGALLLGYYDADKKLRYCGKVGTGFTDETLRTLHAALKKIPTETAPFVNPPRGADARAAAWVKPQLVAQIEFTEWTGDDSLRHPVYHGLREDKKPNEVTREEAEPLSRAQRQASKAASASASAPKSNAVARSRTDVVIMKSKSGPIEFEGVRLTNPDRVLYPDQGITKLEVAEYYRDIAEWMLPYVTNRPLSIVRCPQGRQEKCFFQKNVKETMPDEIGGVRVEEKGAAPITFISIGDLRGLIALVQIGVLEIHPWGSRNDRIERPDFLVFDLDPGPDVTWNNVVNATLEMRDMLQKLGLESLARTSGGKGLHVVVPIQRRTEWDDAKVFAKALAERMVELHPDRYVSNMSKAKRTGKIFVDYLRNGRGATAIASYSTRARPGATVATPLRWEEVTPALDPQEFAVRTIPQRLAAMKKDPWASFFAPSQSIMKAMRDAVGIK